MDPRNITFVLALLAGMLSFLSPCILPLIPAYIGYLSGRTAREQAAPLPATAGHAAFFVLGFTTVFTLIFGLTAGLLGRVFGDYLDMMRQIGGLIVIVLGLHSSRVMRIPFLAYDMRIGQSARQHPVGYLTSFIVGLSFAAGWTPCSGPILGGIFALAMNEGEGDRAVLLFLVSLGLGAPFMVTALALDVVMEKLRAIKRYMGVIERISGTLLLLIGFLLLTNGLSRFARFAPWTLPL